MDLDHISLNAEMLAGLYGNVLVDLNAPASAAVVKAPEPVATPAVEPVRVKPAPAAAASHSEPAFRSLGEHLKQVLVVVDHADAVHLPDAELSFLTGILGACKLSLADVAIVNRQQGGGLSQQAIGQHLKSRVTLLFGIEPDAFGLPMSFPAFQIQPFNQVTYLYAPSLSEIEKDKVLKSKLWVSLRRLFNI